MLGLVSDDGTAQVTPVWIMLDGDTPVFNTVIGSRKERHMRRDPRVTLTIVDPDDAYSYVELRGQGRVRGGPGRVRHDRRPGQEVHRPGHLPVEPARRRARQSAPRRRARARRVMSDRPIRIGLRVAPQHCTYKQMRDTWLRADEQGADSLFTWDHFFPLFGDPDGAHFECWTPARGDGRGDGARPVRRARDLQLLPQPEPARRHGAHDRPHLRRPAHPRPRARAGSSATTTSTATSSARRSRACRRFARPCP